MLYLVYSWRDSGGRLLRTPRGPSARARRRGAARGPCGGSAARERAAAKVKTRCDCLSARAPPMRAECGCIYLVRPQGVQPREIWAFLHVSLNLRKFHRTHWSVQLPHANPSTFLRQRLRRTPHAQRPPPPPHACLSQYVRLIPHLQLLPPPPHSSRRQ